MFKSNTRVFDSGSIQYSRINNFDNTTVSLRLNQRKLGLHHGIHHGKLGLHHGIHHGKFGIHHGTQQLSKFGINS